MNKILGTVLILLGVLAGAIIYNIPIITNDTSALVIFLTPAGFLVFSGFWIILNKEAKKE